ncbi:MAG TPA: DUF3103 family protein [Kofleriaceae bacterium]|nr:DUF3103 family protein [Kofleriaceae bacterium]
MFCAVGCATSPMEGDADPAGPAPAVTERVAAMQTFKQATAVHAAAAMADPATRAQVLGELRSRGSVALRELPALIGAAGAEAGGDAVPEVWLREPAGGGDADQLLIAYAPAGNEHSWTAIPAYTLAGERVTLDPKHAPDVPVLVIETHGKLANQQGIAQANLALQRAGLQRVAGSPQLAPHVAAAPLAAAARWTTRLDSIHLNDDEEPWISGAAEIYAIVSGVVDGDNTANVQIVDMPYLDYDGTTYTPHQILVDWSTYAYQAANILLYEKDDSTSYQSLVEALITAIGAAGSLAGYPTVQAITDIANRIIAAMPSSWFANDDDYVDAYYTIQENVTYTGYAGASRNATVTLTPFLLQPN